MGTATSEGQRGTLRRPSGAGQTKEALGSDKRLRFSRAKWETGKHAKHRPGKDPRRFRRVERDTGGTSGGRDAERDGAAGQPVSLLAHAET